MAAGPDEPRSGACRYPLPAVIKRYRTRVFVTLLAAVVLTTALAGSATAAVPPAVDAELATKLQLRLDRPLLDIRAKSPKSSVATTSMSPSPKSTSSILTA